MTVGLLHPGEMGAAVGGALRGRGIDVVWASEGRSEATAERAAAAGFDDAVTSADVSSRADVIISLCPPHAALAVAESVGKFDGIYVDANAVSPATARAIGARFARFVDGGVIGSPPREPGMTRLYLSGAEAPTIAELFERTSLEAIVTSTNPGDASALKMAYAAWTKGSAALLLATRATAEATGVGEALAAEWGRSQPELAARLASASRSADAKGWRWIGEMEEIARTFASAGQPSGFHEAAADVYRSAAGESA